MSYSFVHGDLVLLFFGLFGLLLILLTLSGLLNAFDLLRQHLELPDLLLELLPVGPIDSLHIGDHLRVVSLLNEPLDVVEPEEPQPEQVHEAEHDGQPDEDLHPDLFVAYAVLEKLPHEVGLGHADGDGELVEGAENAALVAGGHGDDPGGDQSRRNSAV